VEHVDGVIVNVIIHHFKQVSAPVKADKQMFVQGIIPQTVIFGIVDGMAYIRPADTVLERGLVVFNGDFYTLYFSPKRPEGQ
jgi:hypothetical protein